MRSGDSHMLVIFAIALGLAMDALAVSIAYGVGFKGVRLLRALRIGLFFGTFQMIMPLAGWSLGATVSKIISRYDHWVAFGLLVFIGAKMIYEAIGAKHGKMISADLGLAELLLLSLATSIDAFAVGLSFAFLNVGIFVPVLIIGIVTFGLSFAGVYIAEKLGHFFENKIEIVGGLILIAIGIKILLDHL